ncbi:ThiF family adenylyltransferase [Actinokineospora inagensis]|uniref:ThiF family adenylyltransferase n=1 Tax=Actinokineospora inagensis TaxID=103730 RepID=UPI00042120F3|nr:ThiF family adenylyltransferase [Actinokineospora inagensis]
MTEKQREQTLPERPRLRPGLAVVRRRAGELQVGLDPRRALVISDLPEPVVRAAAALTGGRTADEVIAGVGPPHQPVMRDLLGDLVGHGLVEDAGAPTGDVPPRLAADDTLAVLREGPAPPAERGNRGVRVVGDGRLAVALARLLAAAGVGRVHVTASGAVTAADVGTGYRAEDIGRPRQEAAHDAVLRSEATVGVRRFTSRRPDLLVLADTLVPDPAWLGDLDTDGQTHLAVRARDGVGIVGPLVVPGLSSCLRCADHHRAELDPCWPLVAAQIVRRAQPVDLATAHATAGLAAAQVLHCLAWLAEPAAAPPRTWNATIELDPVTATVEHRRWEPHPACACSAATHPSYRHLFPRKRRP